MKSAVKKKKVSKKQSSKWNLRGKVQLLFLLLITVLFFSYIGFAQLFSDNNSFNAENVEAGKPVTSLIQTIVEVENFSYGASPDGIQVITDSLASGGAAKMLSINSMIQYSVNIDAPVTKLIVTARGDGCHGWPNIVINVAGTEILNKKITSSTWNEFSTGLDLQPGTHNISIMYNNDYSSSSGQGCDRNLFLDKVTLY